MLFLFVVLSLFYIDSIASTALNNVEKWGRGFPFSKKYELVEGMWGRDEPRVWQSSVSPASPSNPPPPRAMQTKNQIGMGGVKKPPQGSVFLSILFSIRRLIVLL